MQRAASPGDAVPSCRQTAQRLLRRTLTLSPWLVSPVLQRQRGERSHVEREIAKEERQKGAAAGHGSLSDALHACLHACRPLWRQKCRRGAVQTPRFCASWGEEVGARVAQPPAGGHALEHVERPRAEIFGEIFSSEITLLKPFSLLAFFFVFLFTTSSAFTVSSGTLLFASRHPLWEDRTQKRRCVGLAVGIISESRLVACGAVVDRRILRLFNRDCRKRKRLYTYCGGDWQRDCLPYRNGEGGGGLSCMWQ